MSSTIYRQQQEEALTNEEQAQQPSTYTIDTNDGAETYLTAQSQLLLPHISGVEFSVLVVNNLIFHDHKILLVQLAHDKVPFWGGKIGGPVFRIYKSQLQSNQSHQSTQSNQSNQSNGNHNRRGGGGGEGGGEGEGKETRIETPPPPLLLLNSSIDKPFPPADDISVAEFSRVAARTQVGLDPTALRESRAATALLTAVTPRGLMEMQLKEEGEMEGEMEDEKEGEEEKKKEKEKKKKKEKDMVWLRASLLWTVGGVDEETSSSSSPSSPPSSGSSLEKLPRGTPVKRAWWATRKEVEGMSGDDFFLGVKDDVLRAFELRKVFV